MISTTGVELCQKPRPRPHPEVWCSHISALSTLSGFNLASEDCNRGLAPAANLSKDFV